MLSIPDPFDCKSLYDMLREFAQEYVDLGRLFEQYINGPMAFVAPNLPVTTEALANLSEGLEFIRDKCVRLNMKTSAGLVERARKDFQENRITYGDVKTRAEELDRAFTLELRGHALMLIPDHRTRWYVEHKDPLGAETLLFGDTVCRNFQTAVPEFIEASMCYFANRPTASVFHSMRVFERGLLALAKELQVPFSVPFEYENWQNILEPIQTEIRKLAKLPKSPYKIETLKLYSEAAEQFVYVKDAWRNHVAHSRDSYSEQQAYRILTHTLEFMQHLAYIGLHE